MTYYLAVIGPDDVMPLLLDAVPSFARKWSEIEDDPMFLDEETGTRLHYLDVAWFAPHVVELQRSGAASELSSLFKAIELLHTDGDKYVKELATIGYLEGIQIACSHTADVRQEEFEPYLGPRSRRWWHGLNAFWSGQAPRVQVQGEDETT
jgi:hypothetical protein